MKPSRILLLTFLIGCSSNSRGTEVCTGELARGVVVKLSDAETGEPINGANLTLKAGASEEKMQQTGFTPDAIYDGAIDRAGTFDLTVTADGYRSTERTGIEVRWNGCTLETQEFEISLTKGLDPQPVTAMLMIDTGDRTVLVFGTLGATGSTRR